MSEASKAVFLSYASQDAAAAKRICEALRAAGVEVWFDQSELRGGDAWDQKIRRQIKECALFMPVISANTNARPEGYFRLEWKLAVDRSHLMADDEPFLFPIVIGEVSDATARVPDKFREVQWTRLKLDETPAELAVRIARLLGGTERGAALRREGSTESGRKAPPIQDGSKWWMVFPVLGMLMGLMFAALPLWKAMQGRPPKTSPPTPPAAAAPATSEARQLALRAKGLIENGDDANRQTFATAEELLKRAVALDPSDGEAAAIYAQLSRSYYRYGFDRSQARNDLAHQLAERAVMLAPDSAEAQFAMAYDYYRSNPTESEKRLRQMLAQRPDDKRLLRTLGVTLRIQERREDAIAAWQKAADLPGSDAESLAEIARTLNGSGRPVEAEAAIDRSLALRASGRTLMLKMWLLLQYRGDLDAAQTMLGQLPPWAPFEDRGGYQASQLWLWRRDPDMAIAALERVPREQFNDNTFTGPKRLLTGRAHQMAGRSEAARSEWRRALQLTESVLNEERSPVWLGWQAWLQAALGEGSAETSRRVFDETVTRITVKAAQLASIDVQLGNHDRALTVLEEFADDGEYRSATDAISAAALKLDPSWDPLRSAPRFQALIARVEQHEASLHQGVDPNRERAGRKTEDSGQVKHKAPGGGQ